MEKSKLPPAFDAYFVRLVPDNGEYPHLVAHIGLRPYEGSVRLLSPEEVDELRHLLLDDGELGKTVGKNGVDGEGYVVLNTFPKLEQLQAFRGRLASKSIKYDDFYSMNEKKKAEFRAARAAAAASAVSKAEGGYRRRRSSFRKSSKRALRKKSRMSKMY
jgi:hypothetical protein